MNPRVSRSSALASKATGYPIARIAAKLAIGYQLDEVNNPITGNTYASFEPTIDYIVTKVPRWPFDKFPQADRLLGTQMKATGEVMSLDRNFEASLLKGIRSLEIGVHHLQLKNLNLSEEELIDGLEKATDIRLFLVAEAFRRGMGLEQIGAITAIDAFFLYGIQNIVRLEQELAKYTWTTVPSELLREVKLKGFADQTIADIFKVSFRLVRERWHEYGWAPSYKLVDTCAAEFVAQTPYYYSTWQGKDEVAVTSAAKKVLVLGSGPIRIGQGIEFDYCSVHAAKALKKWGSPSHCNQ